MEREAFRFPKDSTFIIGEIGVNHNGSITIAKKLIDGAAEAGANAVKFQKRTPHSSLPPEKWDVIRDTPFGPMKSLEYRQRMEFSWSQYEELMDYAWERGLYCFASPWDKGAADGLYSIGCPIFKVPSAAVTNLELIEHVAKMKRPVIISVGMSDAAMVQKAVGILQSHGVPELGILACTSTYPAPVESLNLKRIHTLKEWFPECTIGYSGHEVGLWTSLCAVVMGAKIIERHITLDRAMKGSDHAASVELKGFALLCREIRQFERARGNGVVQIQACELPDIERLRGSQYKPTAATRTEDKTWTEENAPWRLRHPGMGAE